MTTIFDSGSAMRSPRPPVVELRGVSRSFAGPPVVDVLRHIDLRIGKGDYVSIVGPSGSGKSTLLNLVGLLDRPSLGMYLLDGWDTSALSDVERTALRGQRIGFVFQEFHLLSHRTSVENVELAELYQPVSTEGRRDRAVDALCQVGLGHRLDAFPTTLSGGERQRVAIARAVMGAPSLLLADEPTGNLDTTTSMSILDVFDELHSAGLTLAVVTHNETVSARARRRVGLVDGQVRELT